MGMTGMTTWTFKTVEKDGKTGYSSAMTKERALSFIRDLLTIGVRVVSLEASDGETYDEAAIWEMCASPGRKRPAEPRRRQ